MDERGGVYTIAVASRLTRMHPQTLRKYERAGLVMPARQAGNQRLYSDGDVRRLLRIAYLIDEHGLNISGLVMVLAIVDHLDAIDLSASAEDLRAVLAAIIAPTRRPDRGTTAV